VIKDELAGLSVLLEVAERKSFTRAAAALGVTPSAVSQTVTGLEARVGVRLLQRTTRSVGLTEAGLQFVTRVRPAVEEVRACFAELEGTRERPAGTLRLNVPRVASRAVLEPLLARFLSAHPDIRLDVTVDDGLTDLVAGGFDAGIRLGERLERDMVAVRIGADERSAVVGSSAYFAAHGRPRHPRDLHDHDCVVWRSVTGGSLYRWEFTEGERDFEVAVSGRVIANDIDLMLRAAHDGLGLAYLFESTVRTALVEKKLERVLAEFCPPFAGLHLYYPSGSRVSPKLRAFIEFLKVRPERRRR
jgi:DNA-binding transcriptional LysR family regulator